MELLLQIQRLIVEKMMQCQLNLTREGGFSEAHLMGKADQSDDLFIRDIAAQKKLNLESLTCPFLRAGEYRARFDKMCNHLYVLVLQLKSFLRRNLRHLGE